MSGGITQLISIGAQDAHIVGDPEVSFFHSTYKRHTNFSHVVSRQVIQGIPDNGSVSSVRFERKGDMLGYVYLTKKRVVSPATAPTAQSFDGTEIKYIELLIGGQVVDKQDTNFSMKIADPLLVGSQNKASMASEKFYPLHFWFCETWSSALPLVALQFHDVEIRITWNTPLTDIYECWADYIYLDTMERNAMSDPKKVQHLLMYQVQMQMPSNTNQQPLVFNQPVKFLASSSAIIQNSATATIKLQLNGTDIGEEKNYVPHCTEVPYYYHCPNASTTFLPNGFLHPFCLDTTKLQPSGSLNFSRLDSARFVSSTDKFASYIYAVSYNVLKIENGMGGLMYAN